MAEGSRIVPGSIILGLGYAARTKRVLNEVTEGDVQERTDAWAPEYEIDYVDTYTKLNRFYSLDASARYSGSSGSASASVSIQRAAKLERRSVVLAVRIRIATGRSFFTTARVKADALKQLAKGLPGFVEKFGDSYISTVVYGGEVAALLTVTTDTAEKLEELRAKAAGKGFGASGAVATTNMIEEVTKNYRVEVSYAQSGGGSGTEEAGIISLTPAALLKRMGQFVKEVNETDSLKGAVVPIEMETAPMTQALGWPGGDPKHPFPPQIERIAETMDMLRTRLDDAQAIIDKQVLIKQSSLESATVIKEYLEATLERHEDELRQIIAERSARASMPLESLTQYRLRRLLRVPPGDHLNAGPREDANSPDKAQLAEILIGPEGFPDIHPWPRFTLTETFGYHGEDVGAYAGLHWRCAKNEHHDLQRLVSNWAGKADGDDSIFVHGASGGSPYRGGDYCGYTPLYAFALKWREPDARQLAPLPELPNVALPSPPVKLEPLKELADGRWEMAFTASPEYPGSTTCAFTIVVTEVKGEFSRRTTLPRSYWVTNGEGPVKAFYSYHPDDGWTPMSWEVELAQVYVMP